MRIALFDGRASRNRRGLVRVSSGFGLYPAPDLQQFPGIRRRLPYFLYSLHHFFEVRLLSCADGKNTAWDVADSDIGMLHLAVEVNRITNLQPCRRVHLGV